jgi:hypothetical protein
MILVILVWYWCVLANNSLASSLCAPEGYMQAHAAEGRMLNMVQLDSLHAMTGSKPPTGLLGHKLRTKPVPKEREASQSEQHLHCTFWAGYTWISIRIFT